MSQILVTGARGTVGTEIARQLSAAGFEVKAASRSGKSETGKAVVFDYNLPETYAAALGGTDAVVLIAPSLDPQAYERMEPFVKLLVQKDIPLVFLSAIGMNHAPELALGRVEVLLQRTAARYHIVRPSFFMENFTTGFIVPMLASGTLYLPGGEARTAFISVKDIAAVIVELVRKGAYDKSAYDLSGGESLTHTEVLNILNAKKGSAYRYVAISVPELVQGAVSNGMPQASAEMLGGLYGSVEAKRWEDVLPDTENVLGRKPLRFADVV
ncbi:MAG: NAD(P)H-binding protein [Flavobacteriales bacterium]